MKRYILYIVFAVIFGGCNSNPTTTLVPTQILEVVPPGKDFPDDGVMILAGVDGNHFVNINIDPYEVYEGSTPIVFREFTATIGDGLSYEHRPKQYDTQAYFKIDSLDRKTRIARVTISGHLVSTNPEKHINLDIPRVTLAITGKEFDKLVSVIKK